MAHRIANDNGSIDYVSDHRHGDAGRGDPGHERRGMLPKYIPDLFQPITLAVEGWRGWARVRVSLGYHVCRWVQHQGRPANDN